MLSSADLITANAKPTIVIVGGGPIGLPHAWGIKKLNPDLEVVILQKYNSYQRRHTLIMQHHELQELMVQTGTEKDAKLCELLAKLKINANIRTQDLETIFKKLAQDSGVQIIIEEVKEDTIVAQLARHNPTLVLGADGSHSVVNRSLFPEDNQVKIELDYVLQMRYEVSGDDKAKNIYSVDFYQSMARHGMIANEYAGRYDEVNKKTPVTMQMMISQEAFIELKTKNSLSLFDEVNNTSGIQFEQVPEKIRAFLTNCLKLIKALASDENVIDENSVRISVNEAPVTYAKTPYVMLDELTVVLVGDAGLGLSYFKGLNAGIASTAKFFFFLGDAFRQGLTDPVLVQQGLRKYKDWFINEFVPKKVKEVEQYSTWQIRSGMKVMDATRAMIESSRAKDLTDEQHVLHDYFNLLMTDPDQKHELIPGVYPHRDYDPVQFGQIAYVPPAHSLIKIKKIFVDFFKPYKSTHQIIHDLKQPLVGIMHLFVGSIKIAIGIINLNAARLTDGLTTMLRGGVEVVTTPLVWLVKPITRSVITVLFGEPKIENNAGMRRVALQGLNSTNITSRNLGLTPDTRYQYLAIANDLHRKFNKSLSRQQRSDIILAEHTAFAAVRANAKIDLLTANANADEVNSLITYFSLFNKTKPQQVNPVVIGSNPQLTAKY
jgi:2-polyprenyl-6-methoxyphenol hydroxylase-like FAD-dependent oxidoreductase